MGWFQKRRERKTAVEKAKARAKEATDTRLAEIRARKHGEPGHGHTYAVPDPTKPNSPIAVPAHMQTQARTGSTVVQERRALELAQHNAAIDQFQADLERIYTRHAARNMRLQGEHLVRRFQMDWNNDALPIRPLRPYTTLPNLIEDGIPDARTQAAVAAYLSLMPPADLAPDALAAWLQDKGRLTNFMEPEVPPEEPRLTAEEMVDDLQEILEDLEDD